MWRLAFSLFMTIALFGCATTSSPGWKPLSYSDAEYAPWIGKGTATLVGQAFLKTRGGDVKKGAGNQVFLMPGTSFGLQRYNEELINDLVAAETPDPRHAAAVRTTVSDGEGRFVFKDIPAGKYVIFTTVTWETPSTNRFMRGTMETQGGLLAKVVIVNDGDPTSVILTR